MTAIDSVKKAMLRRRTALARFAAGLALVCSFLFGAATRGQETPPKPRKASEQYPPLPDPQRVFRLESEDTLTERMAREAQRGVNPLKLKYDFVRPDYPAVPKEEYVARPWEPLTEIVEPPYVCYRRLYFEQINSERYGWDFGLVHPLVSAGIFYFDVATRPYHAAEDPLRRYECDTGYFLPGDPVPLLLYTPELSWPGVLAEAAVIGLGFVMFP